MEGGGVSCVPGAQAQALRQRFSVQPPSRPDGAASILRSHGNQGRIDKDAENKRLGGGGGGAGVQTFTANFSQLFYYLFHSVFQFFPPSSSSFSLLWLLFSLCLDFLFYFEAPVFDDLMCLVRPAASSFVSRSVP